MEKEAGGEKEAGEGVSSPAMEWEGLCSLCGEAVTNFRKRLPDGTYRHLLDFSGCCIAKEECMLAPAGGNTAKASRALKLWADKDKSW
eukprot:2310582-Rhodomonas_salina.1